MTVIFDLDGTLTNTIDTITYYGNRALAHFALPSFKAEEYKYFVGNGSRILVERMLKACHAYTETMFQDVHTYYNDLYNAAPLYLTEPYEGIVPMLKALKKQKIPCAVLSNKPDSAARDVIEKLLGRDLFACYEGDTGAYPLKPDPAHALLMLRRLGSNAEESVFVGDTAMDIATGQGAHMHTVGVTWGFRTKEELQEAGAEFIIDRPEALLSILETL